MDAPLKLNRNTEARSKKQEAIKGDHNERPIFFVTVKNSGEIERN